MKTEQRKCCCGGLPALWWWLLSLLGLGLLYLGMITNKQAPIEQDLTQRSTDTLGKLGYDWVKPVVDQRGRDVYLSGVAPDQDSREKAINNVQSLYGVRTVDASGLKVAGDPVVNTTATNTAGSNVGTLGVGTASGLITAGAGAAATSGNNTTNQPVATTSTETTTTATSATVDGSTPAPGIPDSATTNTGDTAKPATLSAETGTGSGTGTGTDSKPTTTETTTTATIDPAKPDTSTTVTSTNTIQPASNTAATAPVTEPANTSPVTDSAATNAATKPEPTAVETTTVDGKKPDNTTTTDQPLEVAKPVVTNTPDTQTVNTPTTTSTANTTTPAAVAPTPDPEPPVVLDDKQQVCQNRFTDEMGNKTILFTTAKAIIRAQSYPVLDVLANIARDCADVLGDRHIEIGGHTDSDGSDSYNQLLSEQRAAAVKQYLVKKGVNTALLTVKGYGESRPVADNLSVEGRAQNRRIEFKLK